MEESTKGGAVGKILVWSAVAVVALIFVGWLVVALLGTLVKFVFYLLVGAAVVGGGLYLAGKARGAIRNGKFKQLR
jgi:hypothetical protein